MITAAIVIPTVLLSTLLILNKDKIGTPKDNQNVSITVEGMTCEACVHKITKGLKKLNGVKTVSVNLNTKRAQISYKENKVSIQEMKEKISNLGYKSITPEEDTLQVMDYKIKQH